MRNNKTKQLVQGAFLVALYGVLAIINIMLGTIFDIIFIYLISLFFVLYTYSYGLKYALTAAFSSAFVLFIVGELYFLFMGIGTTLCCVFYGNNLRKQNRLATTYLKISLMIKNVFIFLGIESLLGLNMVVDGMAMLQEYIPGASILYFYIPMILILFFISIMESRILVGYTKICMRKWNIQTN